MVRSSIRFIFLPSTPTNTHSRDVAAGICILREAGGLITTANPPANPETDPIQEVKLGSRLYLAIRYVHSLSNPPRNPSPSTSYFTSLVERALILIILSPSRPAGDTPTETGRQQQERVVREVWKRVEALDYSRPGA